MHKKIRSKKKNIPSCVPYFCLFLALPSSFICLFNPSSSFIVAVKVVVKVVVVVTAAAAFVVEMMDIVVEKVMVVVGHQAVTWLNFFFFVKVLRAHPQQIT